MTMYETASRGFRVVIILLVLSAGAVSVLGSFDDRSAAPYDRVSIASDSIERFLCTDQAQKHASGVEQPTTIVSMDGSIRSSTFERILRFNDYTFRIDNRVLPLIGIVGYSRYENSDPLENQFRADIYRSIRDSPGIHISRLSEETLIHRSTVRYHIRVLRQEGLVAERVIRGRHRLYPVESDEFSLPAALQEDATATLLQALVRSEPASVSMLATELDRAPSTVSYHLHRLAEDGLVEQYRAGNTVLTQLPQHIREALRSTEIAIDSEIQ